MNDPNRLDEHLKRFERPKYICLELTIEEFEFVIYEIFEKAAHHSTGTTKVDINYVNHLWRQIAKTQGWNNHEPDY